MKTSIISTSSYIRGVQRLTYYGVVNGFLNTFILCILFLLIGQSVYGNQARTVKSIILREKNTYSTPDEKHILQLMRTKVGSDYDENVLNEDLSTIVPVFEK